jgi:hypothetical protein
VTFTMEDPFDAGNVGAADVHACYADPSTWHIWGHNTSGARARTVVETGAIVDVKVRRYPWTYAVRSLEADPGSVRRLRGQAHRRADRADV